MLNSPDPELHVALVRAYNDWVAEFNAYNPNNFDLNLSDLNARLTLVQNEEGKWRVEFDEEWARQPRPAPPDEETAEPVAVAATEE